MRRTRLRDRPLLTVCLLAVHVPRRRHPLEHLGIGQGEVTRGQVPTCLALERRIVGAADLLRLPAARVEAAAGRGVGRRGDVAIRTWRFLALASRGSATGTADLRAPGYGIRGCE